MWYENVFKFDVIPLSLSSPYFVRVYSLAPLQNSLRNVRVGDVLFLGRRALSTEVRDVACSPGAGRDNAFLKKYQFNLNITFSYDDLECTEKKKSESFKEYATRWKNLAT